MFKRSRIKVKT